MTIFLTKENKGLETIKIQKIYFFLTFHNKIYFLLYFIEIILFNYD